MNTIPQGWECPRCNTINAPHVNQCNCAPFGVHYSSTTNEEPEPVETPWVTYVGTLSKLTIEQAAVMKQFSDEQQRLYWNQNRPG